MPTNDLRHERWYEVPAGAPATQCRESTCKATIHWTVTAGRKKVPVDCGVAGGAPPTAHASGRGVSHLATCSAPKPLPTHKQLAAALVALERIVAHPDTMKWVSAIRC